VNLSWTDNSGLEGGYAVYVKLSTASSYVLYNYSAANATTFSVTGLIPGVAYDFQVATAYLVAANNVVESARSNTATASTPFTAPTNLSAAPGVEGAANLTWTDNSGTEQGYAVYFKLSTSTSYSLYNFSAANATSYSVTGLIPGAAYDFQVAAAYQVDTNTVVESARSNTASATTPFTAPTALTGSSPSEGRFNVSWTDNSTNEGNYELQFRVKDVGSFQVYDFYDANTTSRTNLPVTPGQIYEFRVRATYGSEAQFQSAFSNTFDIAVPFLAPTGLVATASSESAVGLTWTDNSSVEGGYAVYFKTSAAASYTLYDYTATNATSYSITGLTPGTIYNFQVAGAFSVSANNIAESARSNTANATTKDGFLSGAFAPITFNLPFTYQAVVSTGSSRVSWNITGLPAGLSFNSSTGAVTGTPTVTGVFTCPMTATFADGWTTNKNLSLRIIRAPGAPVVGTAFTATSLNPSGSATVSLTGKFSDPDSESAVRVQTNLGNMDFILYNTATPQTVLNFTEYVNAAVNNFNGAVFHRSETGFVIQGGSFKVQSAPNNFTKTPTTPSPVNEPGISNLRGTVAMAKLPGDPNSATTDFFISLADNSSNLDSQNDGFTVFARVAGNGMTVADAIAALPKVSQTVNVNGTPNTTLTNWPVTSGSVMDTTKMVTMTSVAPVPVLSYSITGNTNPAAVSASISGSDLLLNAMAGGQSTLTITATDLDGATVSQNLSVTVGEVPAISSSSPPSTGTVGAAYSFTCTASGVPAPSFAVASGALPNGLSLSSTGEISGTPTNAGTFTGTITASNAAGTSPPQNFSVTIAKAPAAVLLASLSQTYNGSPKSATASTTPGGLTVEFTYNGSNTSPTNAGSYAVVATINDANYEGTANGTLVISKATAPVVLGGLAQTYDGNPRPATASTTPGGLTVEFTYNGSGTAPTNAGSYAVVATINDANYEGTANGTLVISKATAPVVLGGLAQTYDGNPRPATASTTPGGLMVEFTYNGSSTVPTNAGSYAVVATINDANYTGTANGTLVVSKAAASIVLGGLAQTYNGNPRTATASTTPDGLIVSFTYDSSSTVPANAGSYAVVATINDANYEGTANGTLVISKASAPIVLGSLSQTYNGNPRHASASTTPDGLIVSITYDASSTAPANVGSYAVVATISDTNYEGTANGTLVISKATAPIVLGNLSQTYNGNPRHAFASTTPDGLIVSLTYNGSSSAPANVGSYDVAATIIDANYEGTASDTLVISKATAPIVLGNLSQTFNGSPRHASASTTPDGLIVSLTYNGSSTAPTNPGSYAVVATISDANYQGTANGTLTITGGQTISAWRTAQFSPTQITNGDAANNADPDKDKLVNLAEYALGTDPNGFTPPLTFTLDGNGLSLVFTRPRDLPDVIYSAQASENLTSWSPVTIELVTDGPVQTMWARDPLSTGSPERRFLQLIFTSP
jgi:cyclophilin family peptidyl-prolyl cis-trans isomerase